MRRLLALAALGTLLVVTACGSSGERTETGAGDGSTTTAPAGGAEISLATVDYTDWMDAIVTGTLVVDPPCVYLDASERGLAIFPEGAELERRGSTDVISFPDGRTIGPVGAEVHVHGGEAHRASAEDPSVAGVLPECLTDTVYFAAPLSAGTSVPPDTGAPDDAVESPPLDPGDTSDIDPGQPTIVEPHPNAVNQNPTAINRVTVQDDGSLVATFWNGVEPCSQLGTVDVEEAATTVTITLSTGSSPESQGMACIELAQYFGTVVTLDAPLGGRTVIDGSTGQPAPLG